MPDARTHSGSGVASRIVVAELFSRTSDRLALARLLRAAGLIVAVVPSSSDASRHTPSVAQVHAVTQKGLEELARFHYPEARPERWRMRMPRIKPFGWPRLFGQIDESGQSARLH
jgi:hypothetical protein